jgi:DNA-binding transcriptional MerR regulator
MKDQSIGDVSRITGLTASAIRYYEDQGLVRPARLQNGRRIFNAAAIQELAIINDLRQSGMTLADLKKFQMKRHENGLCSDLVVIARKRAAVLRKQINALRLAESRLMDFAKTCGIECADGSASNCSAFN